MFGCTFPWYDVWWKRERLAAMLCRIFGSFYLVGHFYTIYTYAHYIHALTLYLTPSNSKLFVAMKLPLLRVIP